MTIVKALIMMLLLGGVIGFLLGFAGTKLHVDEDTRVTDLLQLRRLRQPWLFRYG